MTMSRFDIEVLARGWRDWIRFAEVQQLMAEAGSADPREDAIGWLLRCCADGLLEPGDYSLQRFSPWPERGPDLEGRMRAWLVPVPHDPLGEVMNLMFDLTTAGHDQIPPELRF